MLNSILCLLPVSWRPVAQKTNEQANIVADTAVTGANEVAQATVEGVENAAVASGFVSTVRDVTSRDPSQIIYYGVLTYLNISYYSLFLFK